MKQNFLGLEKSHTVKRENNGSNCFVQRENSDKKTLFWNQGLWSNSKSVTVPLKQKIIAHDCSL